MPGDRDPQEFATFAETSRQWLLRDAYRLCGDRHEAEDLVQLTLYKVYRRWRRLSQHDELAGYVRQTLLNTFLNERRRPRWRHEVSKADLPDHGTADTAKIIDDRTMLLAAVKRLGPRQRTVVALRFWADLSVEETAAVMGCSPGTVTSQTCRALASLRTALSAASRPNAGAEQAEGKGSTLAGSPVWRN